MLWDRPISLKVDKTLSYVYFMDKAHPLGDKKGRVWYHRHVASLKLGRWLLPHEVVHHCDEDRQNNDEDNLEVMTRKAHSREHMKRLGRFIEESDCANCSVTFSPSDQGQVYCCSECSSLGRRVFDPDKAELSRLVWEKPTTQVARIFGVSDTAVSKRCKLLGIQKPPRGYWSRRKT